MHLGSGGIDAFYIDESHDRNIYVVTAICIPLLRQVETLWNVTWPASFSAAKAWRRSMKENEGIPHTKELHGVKLASGRGNFKSGKHNFSKAKASSVYRNILRNLDHFLPEASIMSACANRGRHLYGNERLEAGLLALFQRMRTQTNRRNASAITFFDQGHPEYRQLYRKSQIYLPTGSAYGVGSRNLPMSMFFEDGNEKNSKHCYFTQVADIVAYAAFLKIKSERGELTEWQSTYNMGTLYDEIPKRLINTRVTQSAPQDGIVRLN